LVDAKDFEGAAAMLPGAPAGRREAMVKRLDDAETQAVLHAKNEALLAREEHAQVEKQRKASREVVLDEMFRTVDARLDAADYTRAVLEADHLVDKHPGEDDVRERAQRLKRIIPTFQRTYKQGQNQLSQSDWRGAQRSLKRARDLLAEGQVHGMVREECKALYVDAAVFTARLEAKEQDWGSAAALYREALQLAPRDDRAQRGLDELADKAEQLLREGESLEGSQPKQAMARFKLAAELSKPGSETQRQAKAGIKRIERLSAP
jgi:tetratricopeptide (TPR) repeat protein